MDWLLDPPEDDDDFDSLGSADEPTEEPYDEDGESANASSRWQNSRSL